MIHWLLGIIYLSFIALGLPDAILGSAWPLMHQQFQVPVSWMGPVSLTISLGTVISSLFAAKLVEKFGTGKITAFSTCMTAVALFGFATVREYWLLYLWAIPYGLGAGCVDSCLNNYVASHYESRHMSWLHCMWGLGATTGPYIMGFVLTGGLSWSWGYCVIGILQCILTAVLFMSLPVWKVHQSIVEEKPTKALTFKQILKLPGVAAVMILFFCYCAAEQTVGQWASSYMVMQAAMSEEMAASLAGLFYLGLTAGRFASGFLTIRFSDRQMIRIGSTAAVLGCALLVLPLGDWSVITGLLLTGLGCAPIYPCVVHMIPSLFGTDKSQSVLGVVVASAYMGSCLAPTAFGTVGGAVGMWLLPFALIGLLLTMLISHERLTGK